MGLLGEPLNWRGKQTTGSGGGSGIPPVLVFVLIVMIAACAMAVWL